MSLSCSIIDILRVRYGFGRHVEYVSPTLKQASMYDVLEELLNVITTALIKISVCLLVRRIIRGTHPKIRVVLWVLIVFTLALTFTTCMVFSLQCRPFRKIWDLEVPGVCSTHLNLGPLMRVVGGESPRHAMPYKRPVLILKQSPGGSDRLCLRHHSSLRHWWASAE